jgi:hypothetical protein
MHPFGNEDGAVGNRSGGQPQSSAKKSTIFRSGGRISIDTGRPYKGSCSGSAFMIVSIFAMSTSDSLLALP